MAKKLTYEFVKESFEREGYKLLSKEYINSNDKLKYKCPNGHVHFIRWTNWYTGKRCYYCSKYRRPTFKEIKSSFEANNYTLLSDKFKNNKEKLFYICPLGHKNSMNWNSWQQGSRCPICAGNTKLTIDFIHEELKKEGYLLLTKNYINSRQKLNYLCPDGHKGSICWDSWKQGNRCALCVGNVKLNIDTIKSYFELDGYYVLSNNYTNNRTPITCRCPLGHIENITFDNWRKGNRCRTCSYIKRSGGRASKLERRYLLRTLLPNLERQRIQTRHTQS